MYTTPLEKLALTDLVGKVGIDLYIPESSMPDSRERDYQTVAGNRDLFKFWGVPFNTLMQQQDFDQRRRHAMKVLHPGKINARIDLLPATKQWTRGMVVRINNAHLEAVRRLSWVSKRLLLPIFLNS